MLCICGSVDIVTGMIDSCVISSLIDCILYKVDTYTIASCLIFCRYVVSSLELLVAQDYMIVYFHGAAPRTKVPSLGWMKRCYQMIDRR